MVWLCVVRVVLLSVVPMFATAVAMRTFSKCCGGAGSVIHDRAACSLLSSAAYTKPLPEEIPFRTKTPRGIASLTFAVARTKVVSRIGR